ncbi:hypothetical protein LY76DRAFT_113332 [Colletotrichum caudatum]|nr:hypothetical protein LY76DRAFT_113332 [Colletotrichum caudatum]
MDVGGSGQATLGYPTAARCSRFDAAKRRPREYAGCPASLRLSHFQTPLPVARIPRDSTIACVVCVCLASGLLGKKKEKRKKEGRKLVKETKKEEENEKGAPEGAPRPCWGTQKLHGLGEMEPSAFLST